MPKSPDVSAVQAKTFSHDPNAHADDPREKFAVHIQDGLNVIHPENQELSIKPQTFSHDSNAHADDIRES